MSSDSPLVVSLPRRTRWQKKSYSRSPMPTQSTPSRPWYRFKVSRTSIIYSCSSSVWRSHDSSVANLHVGTCCRSVLAECEGLQWIGGPVLPGCTETRLWGNRCCQCFGLALSGGPVQQEVQCTHTTHAQTHTLSHTPSCNDAKTQTYTFTLHGSSNSHSSPLTSVSPRVFQPAWRANGAWQRLHVEETDQSPHFQDLGPTCSLRSPALSHDHEGDAFIMRLRPTRLPYSNTSTSTDSAELLQTCHVSTWMLVTTQHRLRLRNFLKPHQRAIPEAWQVQT